MINKLCNEIENNIFMYFKLFLSLVSLDVISQRNNKEFSGKSEKEDQSFTLDSSFSSCGSHK